MRVAIVGGGAAGMAAASRVKRLLGGRAEVVVFERGRWVSFALCGTPYYLGCRVKRLSELLHYPLEEFTERRGIRVLLGAEAVAVERGERRLVYRTRDGRRGVYEYDYLVLATGARPRVPRDWLSYSNVYTLHSLDDAARLRSRLLAEDARRVAVIGGGYTGVEAAENIAALGLPVVLIHAHPWLASRTLDEEVARPLTEAARGSGVELVLGRRVASLEGEGGEARRAVLSDGSVVEADVFLAAPGVEPEAGLAREAGLRIGETGAVWTNERMQTSDPSVYAVGDAAETRDLVTGGRVWWPFAPAANKQGYVAGTNIAGGEAVFPGVVRSSAFGAFGLYVASTGLTEREARRIGLNTVSATLHATTRPRYMGGGEEITLKAVAEAETGRLLGLQAASRDPSAAWRVATAAALLWRGATVWDMFSLDIPYWPGLNPAWDPLVVAARLLMRKLGTAPPRHRSNQ